MNGEVFAFAYPWVLGGLVALPFLAWLHGRRGAAPAVTFSSLDFFQRLGHARRSRSGWFLASLPLLALACFIVALARPQMGRVLSSVEASGIDIVLALDVSRSMLAEDFTIGNERANRLDAVKQVTHKFIEARKNDRIGIVAFAGRPYLVSPLTLDHDWLLQNLERLRIGLVEDGTAIGSAIASAANRLKEKDSKSKIIVLLTDGDNNAGKVTPATAAEAAKALGIKVYAIGAGSQGFAPVPVPTYGGQTVWKNVAVAVDEETLKQVANITGGKFYRATDTGSLTRIYNDIDTLEKTKIETTQFKQYRELFPWFVGAGSAFLGLQLLASLTFARKLP